MLTILICSGCASTSAQLYQAAAEKGRAETKVMLPVLPAEFQTQVPHAPAVLGANPVIVLARERAQLDWANGVIRRFGDFYRHLQSGMKGN
ncbi:hypothetical protein ACLI1C_15990 [Devosia sp. XGJD_8]|uniref:hypothetical protein n=1 Tax=Devosia sp. XGJD_8 TaxID=3391187 RepID=UPI00398526F1